MRRGSQVGSGSAVLRRGGRGAKRVTMVSVERFQKMLRDGPNRRLRRVAAKYGITAAPKAVQA